MQGDGGNAGGGGGGGSGSGSGGDDKPVLVPKFQAAKRGRGESLEQDDRRRVLYGGYPAASNEPDSWLSKRAGGGSGAVGEVNAGERGPTNQRWRPTGAGGGSGAVGEVKSGETKYPPGPTNQRWRPTGAGGGSGGGNVGGANTAQTIIPPGTEKTIAFSYTSKTNVMGNPTNVLNVKALLMDKPGEWAIDIMLKVHHKNILRILAQPNENQFLVDHYDGVLNTYIEKKLAVEESTDFLKDILRQTIEGVTVIAFNVYHHGNLIYGEQYYRITTDPNSPVMVKLANFKKRVTLEDKAEEVELMEAKLEDFFAIGSWTNNFVTKSQKKNKTNISMAEITDFASLLMSFLKSGEKLTAKLMKEKSFAHFYLWSPGERAMFYAYKVSDWVQNNPEFVDKIEQLQCPSSWDTIHDGFYGLVEAMNNHREQILRISKYKGDNKLDYIKFVCGCYAHEHIVKGKIKLPHAKVDMVMRKCDPDLTANLMGIVKKCRSLRKEMG